MELEHGLWCVQSRRKAWPCSWAAKSVFYFAPLFTKVLLKPASHVPEMLVCLGVVSVHLDTLCSLTLCWRLSHRLPISTCIISPQGSRLSRVVLPKESAVGAPTELRGFMGDRRPS